MNPSIKDEITGCAILVLANMGYQSFSIERISSTLDLSIKEIKKYFYDADDLVIHIFQEISRFCHQSIFPIINRENHMKTIDSGKEIFTKFNMLMIRFFNDLPLGIAYVRLSQELKGDERFTRIIEMIKQDWVRTLKKALFFIDKEESSDLYFANVLRFSMVRNVPRPYLKQLH